MTGKSRITIETTPAQRAALDTILRESGTTITDWFTSKLEETIAPYSPLDTPAKDELLSLEQLQDPAVVLANLGLLDWSFTADETGYLSHDIHPYPAKFIPQIPRNLIKRLSLRGETVWDPFGGSGTTALEAILLGRCAISTDANPLAELIGRAKTLTLTKEEEDSINEFAEELGILSFNVMIIQDALESHRSAFSAYIPGIPNIEEWFHPNAVDELAYLRWRIENLDRPKCRTLALVCLSKIVLNASFQDSETRYVRRPKVVSPGSVIRLFANYLASALSKIRQLAPLLRFREADFRTLDLREGPMCTGSADTLFEWLPDNSIDLIVTSPPYANANDYHLYHRFRLFWLGHDPRDLAKCEIGSHLRHQKEATGFDAYLSEMTLCLRNMAAVLRPSRYAVLLLGDSVFSGEVYRTAERLGEVASQAGLECVGVIDRQIHATKRSFIAAARRARDEQLLVLRKPACETTITLSKPVYRLWEYEHELRRREIEALVGSPSHERESGDIEVRAQPLCLDRLRRLTFTRAFASVTINREPTWQSILENGDIPAGTSQRKDPKYATHGIHPYKGKFYPQLAKSLFNLARLEQGGHILDPFCGSGTVLLEAYMNGFQGVGVDLNPLAIKIARVKTEILEVDPYVRDRVLSSFSKRLSQMESSSKWLERFPAGSRDELLSWFPRPVLGKLGWLLNEVTQVPDPRIKEYLEVLLSSIVREVSQQDPKDLRIRRRAVPLEDGPVRELFEQRLREQQQRLRHFAERSKRAPAAFMKARAILGDSRNSATYREGGILPESMSAVVTSPPYATALPYIDTDRLSILLLFGLTSAQRSPLEATLTGSREIGKRAKTALDERIDVGDLGVIRSPTARALITEIRRRNMNSAAGFRRQNMAALLHRYFSDMSVVLCNLDTVLAPQSSAFFVIGDNRTQAGATTISITTGQVLKETGCSIGWELVDVIPITVTKEDRLHSKNSITENEIIWFQKPR